MNSFLRPGISDETSLREFTGLGRMVIASTPHWRAWLLAEPGARTERAHVDRLPAPPDANSAA